MKAQQTRACAEAQPPYPHTHITTTSFRVERWDAWLEGDLEGAQAVVRCACAASEPAFAEELITKAGFSCRSEGGGGGELEGVSQSIVATAAIR